MVESKSIDNFSDFTALKIQPKTRISQNFQPVGHFHKFNCLIVQKTSHCVAKQFSDEHEASFLKGPIIMCRFFRIQFCAPFPQCDKNMMMSVFDRIDTCPPLRLLSSKLDIAALHQGHKTLSHAAKKPQRLQNQNGMRC